MNMSITKKRLKGVKSFHLFMMGVKIYWKNMGKVSDPKPIEKWLLDKDKQPLRMVKVYPSIKSAARHNDIEPKRVRKLLNQEKGHISFGKDGKRYTFFPFSFC